MIQGPTVQALQRFKQHVFGTVSLCFILFVGLVSIFAYALAPDSSQYANQMHLSIHSKSPGFKVKMLVKPSEQSQKQSAFNRFFYGDKSPNTEIPILNHTINSQSITYVPYNSSGQDAIFQTIDFQAPNIPYVEDRIFILGTDKYGRDLLSRILVGSRISFFIGFVAVIISLIIGISLGSIAGYFGGRIDTFIMWLINVTWSIPTLLLVIAITLALGKGFWQVFIAVGLTMWVEVARVVRGEVMGVKEQQYVVAARALGYSDFRIVFKHILTNIMAPMIVISAANFAAAILIESGLSFLGIGAQPPLSSWGAMIKSHYNDIILGKAYLALIPGICIMSLVMAFMLVGNTLRDVLDVKTQ